MALENLDLLVVQKAGGGELRKTTVADLLADAGGGAEVIIQDTAPDLADKEPGTLWWCNRTSVRTSASRAREVN